MLQDDIITKYFKGKNKQIITYTGSDGKNREIEKIQDSFAAIMIRVIGFKDIYSAWESQVISIIDDYMEDNQTYNKKTNYVQAIQTEFIEKAPKVLCL